jgi:hypothetical protein
VLIPQAKIVVARQIIVLLYAVLERLHGCMSEPQWGVILLAELGDLLRSR